MFEKLHEKNYILLVNNIQAKTVTVIPLLLFGVVAKKIPSKTFQPI